MSMDLYKKAGSIIIKSGMLPFPVTETLTKLLKILYTEEELKFIVKTFKRKASQTIEELKKNSEMEEHEILGIIEPLTKKGAVFKSESSTGLTIYRLLPPIFVGIFEYFLMKKILYSDHEKEVAELFRRLFEEIKDIIQDKYDMFLPAFAAIPPIDRTIPVRKNIEGNEIEIALNKEIDLPTEQIIPTQEIEDIVNKFDDIAVGHCFCRQHKDLLGESCKQTELRENCFTFGKSARFVADQGFGRYVSKQEALEILKKSEDAGLVHKVYHPFGDIQKDETSCCNCCSDCCGTFELWKGGTMPMINSTNYISVIDPELCVGCGTCIEKCPVEAIHLNAENKAKRNPEWCIGCGICARFCRENAISLQEGMRKVYVPPPRLRK
jgi:NAD-dependent dihydropyrimidine dehydrogenase PreA subunit